MYHVSRYVQFPEATGVREGGGPSRARADPSMVNGGATLSGEMLGKGYGFRSASRLIGVVLHDSWAITPHLRKERPHRLKKPPAFYLTNVTVRCVLPKSIGLVSMT